MLDCAFSHTHIALTILADIGNWKKCTLVCLMKVLKHPKSCLLSKAVQSGKSRSRGLAISYLREGFKKKKLWNFRLRGAGRIGLFSTKKNNCLKHLNWCKNHFKTILFFSIFRGVVGLFTRTEFLSFETLSRVHLATTRRPVSYRIRFMTFRSFIGNRQ